MSGNPINSSPSTRFKPDLLIFATLGMLFVGVCLAGWGVLNSLSPAPHQRDRVWDTRVDLNSLVPGEPVTVRFHGKPVFVLRPTALQSETAQRDAALQTFDQYARNENLRTPQPATLENRTFENDGLHVIFYGITPGNGCVPMFEAGDHMAWFDPCRGSHFDILGRFRKGASGQNLSIPRYQITLEQELILLGGPTPFSVQELEQLLYGSG
ncbi:MAG: hypothetical protein N4A61_10075 [Pelagimonas sp.]|jgi:ubiquinol-cytochrome c reductase iron-sulfur subunit|nr:hypothetical protein [Pelagimonas sp.]